MTVDSNWTQNIKQTWQLLTSTGKALSHLVCIEYIYLCEINSKDTNSNVIAIFSTKKISMYQFLYMEQTLSINEVMFRGMFCCTERSRGQGHLQPSTSSGLKILESYSLYRLQNDTRQCCTLLCSHNIQLSTANAKKNTEPVIWFAVKLTLTSAVQSSY